MMKKVLIGVAVLLLGLCAVVAAQPSEFALERSGTVNAPPEVVFAQVNDFHQWARWSPWEKMEAEGKLKKTFGGPETGGVGQTYEWDGEKTGKGSMKIVESKPGELVKLDLHFMEPMEANNPTSFIFTREGEGTKVTWRMEGKNNFAGKAFSLVMDMDKMVGKDFEAGLAGIKAEAEAAHSKALADAKAAAEKKAADEAAAANAVAAPTP